MIEPLHIATVGGHRLRFFRTPLDDGRPDFPWLAVEDLGRCVGFDRAGRRFFLRSLRSSKWRTIPRTVATTDGVLILAPHFVAQGLIDAAVSEGMAPAGVRQ